MYCLYSNKDSNLNSGIQSPLSCQLDDRSVYNYTLEIYNQVNSLLLCVSRYVWATYRIRTYDELSLSAYKAVPLDRWRESGLF